MKKKLEEVEAERDAQRALAEKYQSELKKYLGDYKALRSVTDQQERMLTDVWNWRKNHYLPGLDGEQPHAALHALLRWKREVHEQYRAETKKH